RARSRPRRTRALPMPLRWQRGCTDMGASANARTDRPFDVTDRALNRMWPTTSPCCSATSQWPPDRRHATLRPVSIVVAAERGVVQGANGPIVGGDPLADHHIVLAARAVRVSGTL